MVDSERQSAATVQGVDGSIKFRTEYVAPIQAGEKTATVRHPYEEHNYEPGDILEATLDDGEPFDLLEVKRTAVLRPMEVHVFLDAVGFEHNTETTTELCKNLTEIYGYVFTPDTLVAVPCFEVLEQ